MNRGLRAAFLGAFLAANPFLAATVVRGDDFGPAPDASVDLACVPQGGFLVNLLFWISGQADIEACVGGGNQPIGVWNENFFHRIKRGSHPH